MLTAEECEVRKSTFDNKESTCAWTEGEGEAVCEYRSVDFTMRAILLVSVLIACATAPTNMLIDFLFDDIILAPSADEYKVEQQNRELRQSLGQRMYQAAENTRGAIRNSISRARNNVAPMLPVSRPTTLRRRMSSRSMSSVVMESFTVPDATTMKLPPSIMQSHASTSMILKDIFERKEPQSETRRSIIAPVRMSVLLARDTNEDEEEHMTGSDSFVYDSVERGDMRDDNAIPSFESFQAELHKQNEQLSAVAKREFQKRWGFVPDYDASGSQSDIFGSDDGINSGVSAKMRNALCLKKRINSRQQILSNAIEETCQFSDEKIKKLKVATDIQVGLEIMHLFIVDLLGLVVFVYTYLYIYSYFS